MTYALIPITDEDHRQRAEAQLKELEASGRAAERVARVNAAIDSAALTRLTHQAAASKATAQRVRWLHRAADVISNAVEAAGAAACRRGCAHCCHIPVVLTETEARAIGKAIGREPAKQPSHAVAYSILEIESEDLLARLGEVQAAAAKRYVGTPCPFLREGDCSIYANRPLACRFHFSLDDDDFLCRLVGDGGQVSAPYLNCSREQLAATVILGPTQPLADIRDWFAERVE